MYRKSLRQFVYERKVKKCAVMRAAKERKRLEQSGMLRDVGGFVTDGCLGAHEVRLLAYPDGDVRAYAVMVDGEHFRPRTLRGVLRCLAKMVLKK